MKILIIFYVKSARGALNFNSANWNFGRFRHPSSAATAKTETESHRRSTPARRQQPPAAASNRLSSDSAARTRHHGGGRQHGGDGAAPHGRRGPPAADGFDGLPVVRPAALLVLAGEGTGVGRRLRRGRPRARCRRRWFRRGHRENSQTASQSFPQGLQIRHLPGKPLRTNVGFYGYNGDLVCEFSTPPFIFTPAPTEQIAHNPLRIQYSFYIPFHFGISAGYYTVTNTAFFVFTTATNMLFFGKTAGL